MSQNLQVSQPTQLASAEYQYGVGRGRRRETGGTHTRRVSKARAGLQKLSDEARAKTAAEVV